MKNILCCLENDQKDERPNYPTLYTSTAYEQPYEGASSKYGNKYSTLHSSNTFGGFSSYHSIPTIKRMNA